MVAAPHKAVTVPRATRFERNRIAIDPHLRRTTTKFFLGACPRHDFCLLACLSA